jgi:hypothetical protein
MQAGVEEEPVRQVAHERGLLAQPTPFGVGVAEDVEHIRWRGER